MEESPQNDLNTMSPEEDDPPKSTSPQISVNEFSCHCCYDILVNPTTLNCGHSFCRHCLALWWVSSKKTECPECREKWEGFPKVNILLRDAIEKLFPDAIKMRFEDIQQNNDIVQSLAAFQKYGNDQIPIAPNAGRAHQQRGGGFFSGVLTALTGVAVVLLVYHWSSRESEHDLLVHKPVTKWTAEEVVLWLEQLGPWASLYRDRFLSERVNGRYVQPSPQSGCRTFSSPPKRKLLLKTVSPHFLSPRQPPFCFLSLWICLFRVFPSFIHPFFR